MNYIDYETFKRVHPLSKGLDSEKELRICYLREYMISIMRDLSSTDYQAIKYAEGYYTEEEYAEKKEYRENCRKKIREIEKEMEELGEDTSNIIV